MVTYPSIPRRTGAPLRPGSGRHAVAAGPTAGLTPQASPRARAAARDHPGPGPPRAITPEYQAPLDFTMRRWVG